MNKCFIHCSCEYACCVCKYVKTDTDRISIFDKVLNKFLDFTESNNSYAFVGYLSFMFGFMAAIVYNAYLLYMARSVQMSDTRDVCEWCGMQYPKGQWDYWQIYVYDKRHKICDDCKQQLKCHNFSIICFMME